MKKIILFVFLMMLLRSDVFCQQHTDSQTVYKMKYGIDIPVTAAGTAWTLYGFSKIYNRDSITATEILSLNRNNVNRFDRPGTYHYSPAAFRASNLFFYGSMPLPAVLFFDKKIRKDAAKIGLMYLEAMSATGTVYTVAAMSANRFRPYAYNEEVDIGKRTRGGARNSFFAGHVALVGTSTFFMAKVFTDYNPGLRNKWIYFTAAGALTATTGVLRLEAGEHFRTDVITGIAVGTLSGLLIPAIHKNRKNGGNRRLSFSPYFNGEAGGFTARYMPRR